MSDDNSHRRVAELEAENLRLRRTLDENGLPSTLRHQIRNILGVLRAIMRRSAETATSVADYAAHLEGRFDALLRVQSQVLSSPDTRVDLHTLVANELLAHVVRDGEKARISGDDVRLPARTAEVLALALHELATNAIKFGPLSHQTGHVDIRWASEQPQTLTLTWTETGGTIPVQQPSVRGFGMEALEGMLPYQLNANAKIDFRPEGLACTFRLPLEAADGP